MTLPARLLLPAILCCLEILLPQTLPAQAPAIIFEKTVLSSQYLADAINFGDLNNDGHPDIVAGPYWYEGPDFRTRHEYYPVNPLPPETPATAHMDTFVHDINGDGWNDILVFGRVKFHEAFWYENPGKNEGHWEKHFVAHRVNSEAKLFADIDGDGRPELLTHQNKRWGLLAPDWSNPTAPWSFKPITSEGNWKEYHHGVGIGDIDGDGRKDLVLHDSWWKQPENPSEAWIEHPYLFGNGRGGAQMLVYDVNGDGLNDVVSSIDAHLWGLSWFEQVRTAAGGITFREHKIMGNRAEESIYGVAFSQAHALCLGDVNGDGLPDVIVGKRRWAHGLKGDVEAMEAPVIYCFELTRGEKGTVKFIPHLVDDASGVGVQIASGYLNGDGLAEILSASKLGSFLFIPKQSNKIRAK